MTLVDPSEVFEASEPSEVSTYGPELVGRVGRVGRSETSIFESVIVRVRLRSDAFPISTLMPIFRKTAAAFRRRLLNELGSVGQDFHFDGAASVPS